jgi:citrate/tricarballylate utilization protein
MPHADPIAHGAHVLTVCNACRYCEQYCPVFPAMEERAGFGPTDLHYLANLCHNCGECLYACQYAPPHEFGINVPRTLAEVRAASYESYAWPRQLAWLFRAHSIVTAVALAAAFSVVMLGVARLTADSVADRAPGDFYAVIPHGVMVTLFGSVFGFAVLAMVVGVARFVRDARVESLPTTTTGPAAAALWRAVRDGLTLRHLHSSGVDCVSSEEERQPSRRWLHHLVLAGFLLCFASTSVAALYHSVFGWLAPYPYTSLPVVLGFAGGVGLLAGCAGLWVERARRDVELGDPAQNGLDRSFLLLLFVTSLTGLVLMALRESAAMQVLLALHLGAVLALFLTLPYSKFVHGFYRLAALWVYERSRQTH